MIARLIGDAFGGAIDGVHGWDHFFRKRLTRLIPNLRDLIDHPRDFLSYQDVCIGPCRRYVSSTLVGLLVAFAGAFFIGFVCLDTELDKHTIQVLCIVWLFTGPVISIWVSLSWTSGGQLLLTLDHAEFQYRRSTVVCPWLVFNAPGDPAALSYDRLAIPVSGQVAAINSFERGELKQRGVEVDTRQFRLRDFSLPRVTGHPNNNEAVMGDYYAGHLDEIACLLLIIGRELGGPRRMDTAVL